MRYFLLLVLFFFTVTAGVGNAFMLVGSRPPAAAGGGVCPDDGTYMACTDASDWTLDVYNATDGNTVTQGAATLSGSGYTVNTGTPPSFVATTGNNIDFGTGTVEFGYTSASTSPASWGLFYSSASSDSYFSAMRGTSNTSIQVKIYSVSTNFTVPDIHDMNPHDIKVSYNETANLVFVWIDGTRYAPAAQGAVARYSGLSSLDIGSTTSGGQHLGGTYSYFRTKSTVTE